MFSVILIGTGNTATNIGLALKSAGHEIRQVAGRNKTEGKKLSQKLKAEFISSAKKISTKADFYIIAVKDDEIRNISESVPQVEGIVLHTSGSVSINALSNHSGHGVLYPLQSLKKNKPVSLENVPLLIEGSEAASLKKIKSLASSISGTVKKYSSGERLKIHLSAVIVNNFTNHLYTLAWDFLRNEKLHPELLLPLIKETVSSVESSPGKNQTGPAMRNDTNTIKTHLGILKDEKNLLKIYRILSHSITEMYSNQKKRK